MSDETVGPPLPADGAPARRTPEPDPRDADALPPPLDVPDALAPGARLGRYEIRRLLGSGGMGRVYAAHDPSLDREVAIKALSDSFRDDDRRLKRFAREAKVLAALSHPNIAAIYGFEELDGAHYLVLEKVDGGDLARRLEKGPLAVREAIGIAAQVADGLAEAHAKGVIHRDLKPSNVMLSANGRVKLVDFGVAKAVARGPGADPRTELTAAVGVAVGTAPYMSPEQVCGEELDERSDVWAFGCLLFEMLSGQRAFRGLSAAELFVAILRDDPDLSRLPSATPPPVRWMIQRCLHRDPASRPRAVADLRLELLETLAESPRSSSATAVTMPGVARRARRPRWAMPLVAAAAGIAAGALLAALLVRAGSKRTGIAPAAALSVELPRGLALGSRPAAPFAFAPGGEQLALEASDGESSRLYLRSIHSPALVAVDGTERGSQPFFSPDGAWLGFFADRKLSKVPLSGGPPVTLDEIGNNLRGAAWLEDGTIVVSPSQTSGLVRIDANGGRPAPLTLLDARRGESSHRWPAALPAARGRAGEQRVLFTVGFESDSYDEARLDVLSLADGVRRPLLARASYGRYDAASGELLFVRGGRVHAVGLDLQTLALAGTPRVVVDGVRADVGTGAAHFAVSSGGALLYQPAVATAAETHLSWLVAGGRLERISETPRLFREPRLAPDGARVAVIVGGGEEAVLRVLDERGTATQLSFDLVPHRPTWTPDGRRVAIGAERGGRWSLLTLGDDGAGREEVLFEQDERVYPCDFAPDGRSLLFQRRSAESGWDLYSLPLGPDGRPAGSYAIVAATPFNEESAVISKDGRWVAYESDELDGVFQIYARSLPGGERKVRISTGGARWPSWTSAGAVVYWDTTSAALRAARTREVGGELVVTEIDAPIAPEAFRAPPLTSIQVSVAGGRVSAHPDGDRFLVLESSAAPQPAPFASPVLLTRWRELVPGGKK